MMSPAVSDLPRLLFCCFDVVPGPSASSRRLTEYVKGLSERFQVVVLSVKTPDHPHIEKYHGARLLRVPVGAGDLTARAETFDRAVRRQLESEDYVLVHFFDPFGGYALAERRAELGYKLIYDACVFPSMELPFASPEPLHRRLTARSRRQELFCLMNSDAIIVGNPLTRDWVSTMGVDRDRVHVLRAPVDLTPYSAEAMGRPDGRPLRLVHLGSLSGSHGLSVLFEGMALLGPASRVKLALVGPPNPEWRARLEQEAATRGLLSQVEFLSPVVHDEVHTVLANSDAGALTLSDVERNRVVGSPLSRLGEYLAAGRPVLAADVPAARQLVPPEAAVWSRPADAQSLADGLLALSTDLPRRLELGAAARAASVRWDAAKIRADLVALYVSVTGQPARRANDDESEAFDSDDITQLGNRLAEAAEVTQLGGRRDERGGRTSRVLVEEEAARARVTTDPTISAPEHIEDPAPAPPGPRESAPSFQWPLDEPTDAMPAPPPAPRPVLPPPLPAPRPALPMAPAEPRVSTASSPSSATSVAGTPTPPPLPRVVLTSTSKSQLVAVPLTASPSSVTRAQPDAPAAPTSTLGIAPIPLPPISPPVPPARLTVTRATPLAIASPALGGGPEEPLQITDDDVHLVDAADAAEDNELLAADEVDAVEADASPPPSAIDPWLAQLVHGYCPPDSHLFERPVPPTTMPGRDP